jgi:hypothetical protein
MDKADINDVVPQWLDLLRFHDYRLDHMPEPLRKYVRSHLSRCRIEIWRPGLGWPDRG